MSDWGAFGCMVFAATGVDVQVTEDEHTTVQTSALYAQPPAQSRVSLGTRGRHRRLQKARRSKRTLIASTVPAGALFLADLKM
jgi:hypothetical protein